MELDDIAAELLQPTTNTNTTEPVTFRDTYNTFAQDLYNEVCSWSQLKRDAMAEDASQRFSDALPLRLVGNTTIALIGAGGLGNWIWRVLLGMGFTNLAIFDDDNVGIENIGPQAHNFIDIDLPKVEAIRRAALAFRGVNLRVFTERVMTVENIHDALGYTPDIIIGATDSAEFRNGMIADMEDNVGVTLFIDLRMSLGDWNAYITTPKLINNNKLTLSHVFDQYKEEAVFTSEEAVHEPCTARAITYTGANVASYVGAFLHWWFTEGRTKDAVWMSKHFYQPYRADSKTFNWAYTHSSRDFSPETKTVSVHNKLTEWATLKPKLDVFETLFKEKYCAGENYTPYANRDAWRGLTYEGHDLLVIRSYDRELRLDLDAGTTEFVKTTADSYKPAPFAVKFAYGQRGWMQLADCLDYMYPDEEYADLLLYINTSMSYVLFLDFVDHTAIVRLADVNETTKEVTTYDSIMPFTNILDRRWKFTARINTAVSRYHTVPPYNVEDEPEEEERETRPIIQKLDDIPVGTRVKLDGEEYIVENKMAGKVALLKDVDNNNTLTASLALEAECC